MERTMERDVASSAGLMELRLELDEFCCSLQAQIEDYRQKQERALVSLSSMGHQVLQLGEDSGPRTPATETSEAEHRQLMQLKEARSSSSIYEPIDCVLNEDPPEAKSSPVKEPVAAVQGPPARAPPKAAADEGPGAESNQLSKRPSKLSLDFEDVITSLVSYKTRETGSLKARVHRAVVKIVHWFATLEEPQRAGCFAHFISSRSFKLLVNLMIVANVVYLGFATDYAANHSEFEINKDMETVEITFLVFFSVEIVLRFLVHRWYFFCNDAWQWNVFDLFLVMISAYDFVSQLMKMADHSSSVLFMRTFRMVRVVRTARVLRVLRFTSPLRRMVTSVSGSFSSLLWAFVLMAFVFFIFGIAIVQLITSTLQDESPSGLDELTRGQLFDSFGSVGDAVLSCYMATSGGAAWSDYYYTLRAASPTSSLIFIVVIAFTQFALMNILTGVFVENAMKVAGPDRHAAALELRKEDRQHLDEIRQMLLKLDIDSSGNLTLEELEIRSSDPRLKATFSSLGLEIKDMRFFFHMLVFEEHAALSDHVSLDFILDSCMKMRGSASSLDMQFLSFKVNRLNEQLGNIARSIEERSRFEQGQFANRGVSPSPVVGI